MRAITLPTKIAKAKVLRIHISSSREEKREYIPCKLSKKRKSLSIKSAESMPPKRDSRTFLE
jgi:hypothetical protein